MNTEVRIDGPILSDDDFTQSGVRPYAFLEDLRKAETTGKTIYVRINSPGGSVDAAMTICDMIRSSTSKVICVVYNLAASSASLIAISGAQLIMTEGSKLMIHLPSGGGMGTAEELRKTAEALDIYADTIATVYAQKTGTDKGVWLELMKGEAWFKAEEALEMGLADGIEMADGSIKRRPSVLALELTNIINTAKSRQKLNATAVYNNYKNTEMENVPKADYDKIVAEKQGIETKLVALQADFDALKKQLADKEAVIEKTTDEQAAALVEAAVNEGKIHAEDKPKFVNIAKTSGLDSLKNILNAIQGSSQSFYQSVQQRAQMPDLKAENGKKDKSTWTALDYVKNGCGDELAKIQESNAAEYQKIAARSTNKIN